MPILLIADDYSLINELRILFGCKYRVRKLTIIPNFLLKDCKYR